MNYDFDQLVKLVKSGLNDDWISRYLNIDLGIVKQARDGTLQKPEPTPRLKRLTKRERLRSKLVPAARPFPDLNDLADPQRIIALTKHGLSARKIQKHLSVPIGLNAIGRYARKKLGPMKEGNNSAENWINPSTMPYIEFCLKQFGKDKYTCELCLDPVPKGCLIHHTKYQGATVYDLMYICTSCNLARENKGLT